MRYDRIRETRKLRDGYDLDQNSTRFSNYFHLLREVVHLHCGWLARVPSWDVKALMGIHTHEDAEFVSEILERLGELKQSTPYPGAPMDGLKSIVDALAAFETWEEYTGAVYSVLKPALIDAWEHHFTTADPLKDEPSQRLLADFLRVTSEHIKGGMALVETILAEPNTPRAVLVHAATTKVRDLMRHLGNDPFGAPVTLGETREMTVRPRVSQPARDPFLRITVEGDQQVPFSPFEAPVELHVPTDPEGLKRFLHMMMDAEMTAAELCALNVHENPAMPWEYHDDMARQLWDEIRHAQIMEKALEELGGKWGDYPVRFRYFQEIYNLTLDGRLIVFNHHGEKVAYERSAEPRRVLIEHGHRKLALIFDYLLADEIFHIAFGEKWATHILGSKERFAERVQELTSKRRPALVPGKMVTAQNV